MSFPQKDLLIPFSYLSKIYLQQYAKMFLCVQNLLWVSIKFRTSTTASIVVDDILISFDLNFVTKASQFYEENIQFECGRQG